MFHIRPLSPISCARCRSSRCVGVR